MKTKELKLSKKELNLLLSALHTRFEESCEDPKTLVGRLTDKLWDERKKIMNHQN